MPTTDKNAVQNCPQPGTSDARDDELKSVGNGRFVATFHRNAYGRYPVGSHAPRQNA